MVDQTIVMEKASEIVAAFVGRNTVRSSELPEVIATVHRAIAGLTSPKVVEEPAPELKPAVPIKKSVTSEYIISLEDGRKFKSMKRYLTGLGMTPEQYRQKWGLPRNYPMVAPAYAAKRSELAKAAGLGARAKSKAVAAPARAPAPPPAAPAKKRRVRAKKAS